MVRANYLRAIGAIFHLAILLVSVFFSAGIAPVTAATLPIQKQTVLNKVYREGNVYTMRGGLLGIFSTGMVLLANTLKNDYNVHAAHTVYHEASGLSSFIIQHYKAHDLQGPIILAGHSLGANEQIKVAKELAMEHIPVTLLITVDAGLPLKIPSNVQQVLNLYQPTIDPVFKGVPLEASDPKLTYVENINVSTIKNIRVNHFTISQNSEIQKIMLKKILAVLDPKKL
ncbi:MAG: hypothetical protein A3F46_06135 [Legionellales bacterium RIFCSPHIGHO2_12_FULL_42_9]|nr:MAG: hypothetical protein A3F46_06135 [Legionellales bacterium RIFCSPHIGHO2_12_FULL_42_9]